MENLLSFSVELISTIVTIVVGAAVIIIFNKIYQYLESLKGKDELKIIDLVTNRVAEYAEAELKGASGKEKRDFAVNKAVQILASRGISVNKEEIIAGIENGVNQLKATSKTQVKLIPQIQVNK